MGDARDILRKPEEENHSEGDSDSEISFDEGRCSNCCTWECFFIFVAATTLAGALGITSWWLLQKEPPGLTFQLVDRPTWGAHSARNLSHSFLCPFNGAPLSHAVVRQTVTDQCFDLQTCSRLLRALQKDAFKDYKPDMPYHFLVGGDGKMYEGRGWGFSTIFSEHFNNKSLVIAFIGKFELIEPPGVALQQAQIFLDESVKRGHLETNYKLVSVSQLVNNVRPQDKLDNVIQKWSHWENCKEDAC